MLEFPHELNSVVVVAVVVVVGSKKATSSSQMSKWRYSGGHRHLSHNTCLATVCGLDNQAECVCSGAGFSKIGHSIVRMFLSLIKNPNKQQPRHAAKTPCRPNSCPIPGTKLMLTFWHFLFVPVNKQKPFDKFTFVVIPMIG